MWHTNRYDNNEVSYRIYLMNVDLDGGSSFNYLSSDGKSVIRVPDYHGAVRLFTNTVPKSKEGNNEGEEEYLWHTVVSEKAHRLSLGFEILPEQIVALLDSCEGCWDDLLQPLRPELDILGAAQ